MRCAKGRDTGRDPDVQEHALAGLGAADRFVSLAYEYLLGRAADDGGRAHYAEAVRRGDSRTSVLRSLLLSPEFADRFGAWRRRAASSRAIRSSASLAIRRNGQPGVGALLRSLGLPDDKISMHRKAYEFAQLAYGLKTLGCCANDVSVLSVGAGHEAVLYWLANHVGRVIATDMYEGVWQNAQSREGDAGVLQTRGTTRRSPIATIAPVSSDGRSRPGRPKRRHGRGVLTVVDRAFRRRRGRRPGDRRDGPSDQTGRHPRARHGVRHQRPSPRRDVQPRRVRRAHPAAGLVARRRLRSSVYTRYDYAAVDLYGNPHQTPHMVVRFNDTVFTHGVRLMRKT